MCESTFVLVIVTLGKLINGNWNKMLGVQISLKVFFILCDQHHGFSSEMAHYVFLIWR